MMFTDIKYYYNNVEMYKFLPFIKSSCYFLASSYSFLSSSYSLIFSI